MLPFNTLRAHSNNALTKSGGASLITILTTLGFSLCSSRSNGSFLFKHADIIISAHTLLACSEERNWSAGVDGLVCPGEDQTTNNHEVSLWRL